MAIESATTATKTGQTASNAKQFQALFNRVIAVRVVFEEDSIASGASSAAVYTVNGAAFGDMVLVAPLTDLGDDIRFSGHVTAANEVTVIATDCSAATNTSAATASNLNVLVLGVDNDLFSNAASY
jgi:hypothetical protein